MSDAGYGLFDNHVEKETMSDDQKIQYIYVYMICE